MKKSYGKLLVLALVVVLCLSVLLVACDREPAGPEIGTPDKLGAAKAFLDSKFNTAEGAIVDTNNYTVAASVMIAGMYYPVTWTSSNPEITIGAVVDGFVTINIPRTTPTEIEYKLIATIKANDGSTVTSEYDHKINAYKLATREEYLEACAFKGDGPRPSIRVKGYVVGINAAPLSSSVCSLWLQDEDGFGYYVYAPAVPEDVKNALDEIDVKYEGVTESANKEEYAAMILEKRAVYNNAFPIGTEVEAAGTCTVYGGAYEFNKGATLFKTGENKASADIPYADATEDFGNAVDNKDSSLLKYQSVRVTIKDAILGRNEGKNYYFYVNGVQYICYHDIYLMDDATLAAFTAKWTLGSKVDLSGIVNVYSSVYQVYPESADSIKPAATAVTAKDKIAVEKAYIAGKLQNEVNSDAVVELSKKGHLFDDVAISFAGDNALVTVDGGKITYGAANADTTVKVTATFTSGTETDTLEVSVKVLKKVTSYETKTIAEFMELGDSNNVRYILTGTVKEIQKAEYGNVVITDGTNEILVYGLCAEPMTLKDGKWDNKKDFSTLGINVGDEITILGCVGSYNSTKQVVGAGLYSPYELVTIPEFKELADSNNTRYRLTGTVKEIQKAEYGNVVITDGTNEILVYGLCAEPMTLKDGKWDNKKDFSTLGINVGDEITILGCVGSYNSTKQVVGAGLLKKVAAVAGDDNDDEPTPPTPVAAPVQAVLNPQADTAYKFALNQLNRGEWLYFAGDMDGYYFKTTNTLADATDVFVEIDGENYSLYYMDGVNKKYLVIEERTDKPGSVNVKFSDTASTTYTLNTTYNTFECNVAGNTFYMGTFNNNKTISASKIDFLADGKADTSQFIARLCTVVAE